MKLHQMKYLVAIVENNFNITTAAEKIYTSQPGISKQLRLLEDELDLKIPKSNQFIARGMGHIDLLNNPLIYQVFKKWLEL